MARRTVETRRWGRWVGAALVASAALGCAGREGPRPAADPSWTRTLLVRLRDAHGGEERWRTRAAVSFSYVVEAEGTELSIREVGFRTEDYRYLWVSGGDSPVRLDLAAPPGELFRAALEAGAAVRRPGPDAAATRMAEDVEADLEFALRALRYLFDLPLATVTGRWEFRSIVPPGSIDVPPALELVPLEPASPLGACLVHAWEGRPLRQVLVLPAAGYRPRGPFRVLFDGTQDVDGHPVATTRCHVPAVEGLNSPAADPLGRVSAELSGGGGCRIRERVGEVRFLGQDEAMARYPVPEDTEPPAPVPDSSSGSPEPR